MYKAVSEIFRPVAVGCFKNCPQSEQQNEKFCKNSFLTFRKDMCCSVHCKLLHSYPDCGNSFFFRNFFKLTVISHFLSLKEMSNTW